MLKVLTILVSVSYIWCVEEKVCPICAQEGLIEISGKAMTNRKRVICSNENYIHLQFGDRHFLARTEKNVIEEIGELALN